MFSLFSGISIRLHTFLLFLFVATISENVNVVRMWVVRSRIVGVGKRGAY